MNAIEKPAALLGRFLIVFLFFMSGFTKLTGWSATAGFMAAKGLPAANLFLFGAVLVETVVALALLLGYRARWAAGIMFLYLIPVTLMFHNFWAMQGADRMANMYNFMKNLAIMGGLLMVVANGAGGLSIDARRGASR